MTAYGLVAHLVWAGVVLYALRQFASVADRWVSVSLSTPVQREDSLELPPDLKAFVNQYTSSWARDDALKVIRERYEQSKNWNMVRQAVGVGVVEGT